MNNLFYNLKEILKIEPIYLKKLGISIKAARKLDGYYYLNISFNKTSYDWIKYDNFTILFKEELNNFINKHPVSKNIWND